MHVSLAGKNLWNFVKERGKSTSESQNLVTRQSHIVKLASLRRELETLTDSTRFFSYTPLSRSGHLPMMQCGNGQGKAKQVACHITNYSPDSWKENMLSLLTGLGKQ